MGFAYFPSTPTSLRQGFMETLCRDRPAIRAEQRDVCAAWESEAARRERLRLAADEAKRRFAERLDLFITLHSNTLEPRDLQELEEQLHQEVARDCLDPVVGALIQSLHDSEEIQVRASVLQLMRPHARLQKSDQRVRIPLLGGSQVEVITPYYLSRPPRGRGRPREKKGRKKGNGNGLYPVLEGLGVQFRMSPALVSEVAPLLP